MKRLARYWPLLLIVGAGAFEGCDGAAELDDTTEGSGGVNLGGQVSTGGSQSTPVSMGGAGGEGTGGASLTLDEELALLLATQDVQVTPLQLPDPIATELFSLGEALFFDPILSGNKDVACASCHHPGAGTGDELQLGLGVGARGVGAKRGENPNRGFIPRHSQPLYNIGDPGFVRMFWDGRVERLADGSLKTPAGSELLDDLDGALAAQAMFPVVDRFEMRGQVGDLTTDGQPNELAGLSDDDFRGIWSALMVRLLEVEGYRDRFAAAYPEIDSSDLTFAHAANAIAAYETQAFSFSDSPWDEYLRGKTDAISSGAKLGAILFYSPNGCGECHSGPLLTDHEFHVTGVPQLGPGTSASSPFDFGREEVTGDAEDRFKFRTPALRNVELSAPYMHNGAFLGLQEVVTHYAAPLATADQLDDTGFHPDLVGSIQNGSEHVADLRSRFSEKLDVTPRFAGLSNIRSFLLSLTSPSVGELETSAPTSVPSELPVGGAQ